MKRPYRAMQDFCLKNAGKIEKDIHKIENLEQRVEKIADGKKAAGVENCQISRRSPPSWRNCSL